MRNVLGSKSCSQALFFFETRPRKLFGIKCLNLMLMKNHNLGFFLFYQNKDFLLEKTTSTNRVNRWVDFNGSYTANLTLLFFRQ
jgi:hypothetical protein